MVSKDDWIFNEFNDQTLKGQPVFIGPWIPRNSDGSIDLIAQKAKEETYQKILQENIREDDFLDYYEEKYGKGYVFKPEKYGQLWSFEKNQLFAKVVLSSGRPIHLKNLKIYANDKQKKLTGTSKEILWALDNGYSFKIDEKNNRLCIGEKFEFKEEVLLKPYKSYEEICEGVRRLKNLYKDLHK